MFLLHFETGLLDSFVEEHVEDGLHLLVIVKEIVVLYLSNFVDTSLLGNVPRGGRFRLECISLQFHFCDLRCRFALFG